MSELTRHLRDLTTLELYEVAYAMRDRNDIADPRPLVDICAECRRRELFALETELLEIAANAAVRSQEAGDMP